MPQILNSEKKMKLIETIKESFRPELPIKQEIIERERKFNSQEGPSREKWLLQHTYLCEGGLEELKEHPDYNERGISIKVAHFPFFKKSYFESGSKFLSKQPKKVRVEVKKNLDEEKTIQKLERELKLAIEYRGCNSGIYYKRYEERNHLIAEAVPAILSGE